MRSEQMRDIVVQALEDAKGIEVRVLDVRPLTDITDVMVVASGRSDRHVKALAEAVNEAMRQHRVRPLGVEGEAEGEWILLDFNDVVVHIMRPKTRAFYDLEKLWSEDLGRAIDAHRAKRQE